MKAKYLALAIAAIGTAHIAHAADEVQQIEKIQVTGSNIKRTSKETAVPVQVVTKEAIAATGALTLKDALESTSAATGGLSDITGGNSFASGASSTSLRNLGTSSTLVLLNGRRVAAFGTPDYAESVTNIDALPLDMVERVEILKSGASAIYGSDAVAGVINIITRKDYQGLQAKTTYSNSMQRGLFDTVSASLTGGMGSLSEDRYNVMFNAEAYKRDGFVWRDALRNINPEAYRFNRSIGTFSSYSYPGNLDSYADGSTSPAAGCTPAANGLCMYDRYERFQAVPESKRANFLVAGTLDLGNNLQAYGDATYAKTKTSYLSAFTLWGSGDSSWANPITGEFKYMDRTSPILADNPYNTTGDFAGIRYRFVDSGEGGKVDASQYRVLAGLRGTLGDYDWDGAVGQLGSKATNTLRGAFSESGFIKHIGDYKAAVDGNDPLFFNRTYKLGQQNSAAVLNELFPTYAFTGETTVNFFDAKLTGGLVDLPAGLLSFAVGTDIRHEKLDVGTSENIRNGDIVGYGFSGANSSRTYGSIFGELSIPVSEKIEAQLAARADKFPNLDPHVSPKLALRYQPTKQLVLRGSVETGFRAPNLSESSDSLKTSFTTVVDPKRCDQAQALATDLENQAKALPASDPQRATLLARADSVYSAECTSGVLGKVANNPDIKPEESKSFNFGFVLEPLQNFSMSADYWRIERKNEIRTDSYSEVLNREGPTTVGIITRKTLDGTDRTFTTAEQAQYGVTAGQLLSITSKFKNVSKTKTDGVDFNFNLRNNLGALGTLTSELNATYLMSYRAFSEGRNDWGDNLAGRYGYSRLIGDLSLRLKTGAFSNTIRVAHESGTSLQGDYDDPSYTISDCAKKGMSSADCKVDSFSRVDYSVAYTGIKNLTASLFIKNVLNRKYFDQRAWGEDGGGIIPPNSELINVQGRMFNIGLEYKFF
ncbi:TonB-dependent receptor plug domain-containing protein [Chitinimonas taiwanensis]|uniref:Iron complex outermembrane recepter protein n=1 Tax=Chitinimonas taiwanensis DSM 18899 TaxID=1121279 RepID=A0A1K2HCX5_9NEIS|nr:TonB-dependent receptor [Chitinimonas taiwanensis]SFZ74611.1 iron complex outermembrane recepter protein [Chitinimonas taiwanensis DSM 18899]